MEWIEGLNSAVNYIEDVVIGTSIPYNYNKSEF